ncbi:MAG TPA: FG-GAP repeat protein [Planctomycetota bacterium]
MLSCGRSLVGPGSLLLLAAAAEAQVGTVLRAHRIDALDGLLEHDDYLGQSLALLGDLDGDGLPELAVGATHQVDFTEVNDEAGAVWILFLRADGTVRSFTEIGRGTGGFTGALPDAALFGSSLEALGDLDGDGRSELGVISFEPNPSAPNRAPIGTHLWILFLDASGQVRRHARIDHTDPVFQPPIDGRDLFGLAGSLGDTDGDGLPDVALGSSGDDTGPGADAGAFWVLRLNADGSARSALKIGRAEVPIEAEDRFGNRVSRLGDIDRDGFEELAVSSFGADGGTGSVWILSLRPDQTVADALELDGAAFELDDSKSGVASIGDLDGDRVPEVVVTLPDYFTGQPPRDVGGLMVAFLAPNGSVRKRLVITRNRNGLTIPLPQGTGFGREVEFLGDLDKDGNPELATGGIYFDDEEGTLWILSLRGSPVREGRGVNPVVLRQKADPEIGRTWRAALDCRGHAPGLALLGIHPSPLGGVLVPGGELLVAGAPLALFQQAHAGTQVRFDVLVPPLVALVHRPLHAQGACTGAPGPRLSNALDLLVGR